MKNDIFKCVSIPNTAILVLPEFLKDPEARKLDSSNADNVLRSSTFLPYAADTYQITIGRNKTNNGFFLYSSCTAQLTNIEIFEPLDDATGITSLF